MDMLSLDKLVHLFLFAILAMLWARVLRDKGILRLRAGFWGILFGTVFGAIIEILQANLPIGRSGNVYDFIADFAGSVLGMLFFLRMTRFDEQTA